MLEEQGVVVSQFLSQALRIVCGPKNVWILRLWKSCYSQNRKKTVNRHRLKIWGIWVRSDPALQLMCNRETLVKTQHQQNFQGSSLEKKRKIHLPHKRRGEIMRDLVRQAASVVTTRTAMQVRENRYSIGFHELETDTVSAILRSWIKANFVLATTSYVTRLSLVIMSMHSTPPVD